MSTQKRSVVVGGAGFIGSNLVDALVKRGDKVDVIDNLAAGKKENVNPNATLHKLDITNYKDIAPVPAQSCSACAFFTAGAVRSA